MATIRSSIDQKEAENLEKVVKPLFRSITLGDHRRIHILFQDFKLFYDLRRCDYKLAVVLDLDEEKRLKEKYAVLKLKGDSVDHIYSGDLGKAFIDFYSFIDKYSFRGLVREFGFTGGLGCDPSDVNYYDFTR